MCESRLHGPRNYVDRVWGRSASCIVLNIRVFLVFKNLIGLCVGKGTVNMKFQEASCEYVSEVDGNRKPGRQPQSEDIV